MGVSIEGSEAVWPGEVSDPILPEFNIFSRQNHYVEVFNRGKGSFTYVTASDDPWITFEKTKDTLGFDDRLFIKVNWNLAPKGKAKSVLRIRGTGKEVAVIINTFNPAEITPESLSGFIEGNGYVSIEAEHFTRITNVERRSWKKIEDYGHTLSAMRATAEVDAAPAQPGINSPCLEYQIYLFSKGTFDVTSIFSPTLNFMAGRALKYAVSFDNEAPQIITLVPEDYNARNGNTDWEKTVSDNQRLNHSLHTIKTTGYHTLKIFMIDPGVVLQKIVVNSGGLKPSYLGPPESYFKPISTEK
jgi:hypothetical protein